MRQGRISREHGVPAETSSLAKTKERPQCFGEALLLPFLPSFALFSPRSFALHLFSLRQARRARKGIDVLVHDSNVNYSIKKEEEKKSPEVRAAVAARSCRSALNQVKPQVKPQLQKARRAPDTKSSSASPLMLGGVQQVSDPRERFRTAFIRDVQPIRVKTVRFFCVRAPFPPNSLGKRCRPHRTSAPSRRQRQAGGRARALSRNRKVTGYFLCNVCG